MIPACSRRFTLILPISSLNFLMLTLLHLPLENASSLRLIETGDLEYLGRVEVRVGSSAHDGDVAADHLVDRSNRIGEVRSGKE